MRNESQFARQNEADDQPEGIVISQTRSLRILLPDEFRSNQPVRILSS